MCMYLYIHMWICLKVGYSKHVYRNSYCPLIDIQFCWYRSFSDTPKYNIKLALYTYRIYHQYSMIDPPIIKIEKSIAKFIIVWILLNIYIYMHTLYIYITLHYMILYVVLCYMSVWIRTLLEKVLNILIHAPNANLRRCNWIHSYSHINMFSFVPLIHFLVVKSL